MLLKEVITGCVNKACPLKGDHKVLTSRVSTTTATATTILLIIITSE